jgi:hypothetical protein
MLSLVRLATIAGFVLVLGGTAAAGTITTPTLFEGGASAQNVCVVTNVSAVRRQVTVEIVGFFGAGDEATCLLDPGDSEGCQAFLNGAGYCKVTAAGTNAEVRNRFRAVMMNRLTNIPFTINATVEAR